MDSTAPVIKPKFHHVTIKTSHLSEMIEWYGVVIGAKVTFRDEFNAWTTNDAANHRVAFLAAPGLGPDKAKSHHTGMHHSAFEYDSFADLMASFRRMADAGIVPAFCLDHGLTTSLYYEDPENNFVELQSDNFDNWEVSTEYMRTSAEFKRNPTGTPFDPEKVYAAHASGVEPKTLQADVRAGKYLPTTLHEMGLPPQALKMVEAAL